MSLLRADNCRSCHKPIEESARQQHQINPPKPKPPPLLSHQSDLPDDGSSFVFILKAEEINQRMETNVKRYLEDYAEKRTNITHSICPHCFDYLIQGIAEDEKRLKEKQFKIEQHSVKLSSAPPVFVSEDELSKLKTQNRVLTEQLAFLESQIQETKRFFESDLLLQHQTLYADQVSFSHHAIRWRQEKHALQEREEALKARFAYASQEVSIATSVINDSFFIWEEPPYFSINKMKLGRSFDAHEVEWQEVNAAWGELCLLLHTLSKREGLVFSHSVLIPRGRRSVVTMQGQEYELFMQVEEEPQQQQQHGADASTTAGNYFKMLLNTVVSTATAAPAAAVLLPKSSLAKIVNLQSFNMAMVAFLTCLKELGEVARDSNRGLLLGLKDKLYPIRLVGREDACISSFSIKTTGDPSDAKRWSEACKYTLTNAKWLALWSQKLKN